MNSFRKKWGLILNAFWITLGLLVLRLAFDFTGLDILILSNLITAFISGAIFTIAIILAGVLTDFKESEKIPGELATSIRTICTDLSLIRVPDKDIVPAMQEKIFLLLKAINTNFRNNAWDLKAIDSGIDAIVADISRLVDLNVPPQYTVKLKNELGNIDRTSHRIKTIAETSFIPAAYAISEIAAACVVIILIVLNFNSLAEAIALFTIICLLMISLLLLIRDMDNPFEVGLETYADIDLFLLWDLEKEMEQKRTEDQKHG